MPACRLNPDKSSCYKDDNIFFPDLDEESQQRCKQDLQNCRPFIGENQAPVVGGKRRKTRKARKSRRVRKSRRS